MTVPPVLVVDEDCSAAPRLIYLPRAARLRKKLAGNRNGPRGGCFRREDASWRTGDDGRHRQCDHGGAIARRTQSVRRRQYLELEVKFL